MHKTAHSPLSYTLVQYFNPSLPPYPEFPGTNFLRNARLSCPLSVRKTQLSISARFEEMRGQQYRKNEETAEKSKPEVMFTKAN